MLRRLIEGKADINIKSKNGDSLLHFLYQNSKSNNQMIQLLLESGIDINHQNKKGETGSIILF